MINFIAAILIVLVCVFPVQGEDRGVRVLSEDSFGLVLEIDVPPPVFETVDIAAQTYSRVKLKGWAATLKSGSPELPAQGFLIQVPQSGDITVEAAGSSPSSVPNLTVSPVPYLKPSDDGQWTTEYSADEAIYLSSAFYPGRIAVVQRAGIIRGVPVARVIFYPFQWNPAAKELHRYSRITARVSFQNPLLSSRQPLSESNVSALSEVYQELLRQSVINYSPSSGQERHVEALEPVQSTDMSGDLKIMVKQSGLYRITYEDLKGTGIDVDNVRPNTFRLYHGTDDVFLRVVTAGTRMKQGDYLEFYAERFENTFTDTNVYRLSWGKKRGKRIPVRAGGVTGQGTLVTSFLDTIHLEQNNTGWGLTPGAPEQDYWFWEKITAPAVTNYPFTLQSLNKAGGTGKIKVCFRGASTAPPHPDHHTKITLNGTLIGDARWDGSDEYIQEADIPLNVLLEGTNTLTVESPGDTGAVVDIIYLNWIEISYWRQMEAKDDELTFTVTGEGRFRMAVNNLSSPDVRIFDITSPFRVSMYKGFTIAPGSNGYIAAFEDDLKGRKSFYLMTDKAVKSPFSTEQWRSAGLKSEANSADYIVITPREFLESASPLITFREQQGLRVKPVAVEDIYNEFGNGTLDPQAIKDFLTYTYAYWRRPAPAYVLLLGDGTLDYRDNFATGKKTRVPVHLLMTPDAGLVPDDNWYVAIDGNDVLPDMIIGRVPAADATMAADMVQKILGYENANSYSPRDVLFAADNNDIYFETINENLVSKLPAGYTARKVYLRSYSTTESATSDIISYMNNGMMLTNYVGHGDVTHWAGESLFVPEYISRLNNGGKLTFLVTLDCMNGYFAHPFYYSISEAFVAAKDRGAIAAFSPSGLGYPSEHMILGNEIFSSIFQDNIRALGAITTRSKINAFANGVSEDVVRIFTLIGDPAVRLKRGE